jgi:hypothetical protein
MQHSSPHYTLTNYIWYTMYLEMTSNPDQILFRKNHDQLNDYGLSTNMPISFYRNNIYYIKDFRNIFLLSVLQH